jgi:hypothetical protein
MISGLRLTDEVSIATSQFDQCTARYHWNAVPAPDRSREQVLTPLGMDAFDLLLKNQLDRYLLD